MSSCTVCGDGICASNPECRCDRLATIIADKLAPVPVSPPNYLLRAGKFAAVSLTVAAASFIGSEILAEAGFASSLITGVLAGAFHRAAN